MYSMHAALMTKQHTNTSQPPLNSPSLHLHLHPEPEIIYTPTPSSGKPQHRPTESFDNSNPSINQAKQVKT